MKALLFVATPLPTVFILLPAGGLWKLAALCEVCVCEEGEVGEAVVACTCVVGPAMLWRCCVVGCVLEGVKLVRASQDTPPCCCVCWRGEFSAAYAPVLLLLLLPPGVGGAPPSGPAGVMRR